VRLHRWRAASGAIGLASLLIAGAMVACSSATTSATSPPSLALEAPASTASVSVAREATLLLVPPLVGKPFEDARARLADLGLEVGSVDKKYSHEPSGTVLHMSLHPGAKVDAGTSITIVIAQPFPKVPGVVGMSTANATAS
jgi:beta-lactam-binding protein with PASTA domain